MSNLADAQVLPARGPRGQTTAASRTQLVQARRACTAAFLIVLVCAIAFAAPIYWMIVTSLKTSAEVFQMPPVWWPPQLRWSNYPEALAVFPFVRYAANTLRIAVPVAIGTTLSSALVAYGFSRLRWPGRDVVFYLVLATLMIPTWVTLVPLYILFNDIGWVEHLPSAGRAQLLRRRLLDLPARASSSCASRRTWSTRRGSTAPRTCASSPRSSCRCRGRRWPSSPSSPSSTPGPTSSIP